MKYGCIGEVLKHSFSKEVHNALCDYDYEIKEIERDALCEFAEKKDFKAINVTIPYKELIMPYLDYIDEHAKEIGAVNTVVNRDGQLFGYNTDFYGLSMLIKHAGVEIANKKVAILGSGGTSKTSYAVTRALGAREIIRVSREGKEGAATYEEFYEKHNDTEVIINTTPVGMFPNIYALPIDISRFDKLSGVIDAVYNPLRTKLISEAKERHIAAEGGLYMLIAQGVRASEIFTDTKYGSDATERVYKKILCDKENAVLIGMPASGKSTIGAIVAEKLGRRFIDTDTLIEEKANMAISEIFEKFGEEKFRDLESEVISECAKMTSVVIATGGGAILRKENRDALKMNGRLFFIDRPLKDLIPTENRPLAKDREAIEARYRERYDIYTSVADERIDASQSPEKTAEGILNHYK